MNRRPNNDFRFVLNSAEHGQEEAEAIEDRLVEERIRLRLENEFGNSLHFG